MSCCNGAPALKKAPGDVSTWGIEWKEAPASFLFDSETIISEAWSVEAPPDDADPLAIVSSALNGTQTTVRVEKGTSGNRYRLTCQIGISSGDTKSGSLIVDVK